MIKFTLTILLVAFAAYSCLTIALYTLQRTMLYYPTLPVQSREAEEIWLTHNGLRLKVWHVLGSKNRALIYFGGNAEDVALNIPGFKRIFPDHSIFLHNYRGFGGSEGKATEEGLFADALALYDYIQKTQTDITVMGRSLGTGVAVYLASTRPVGKLLLVTPFDSMTNVAAGLYPYFPVRLLLRDRYDSVSRTDTLTMPILVLIAENDEVIPRRNSDNLIAVLRPENTRVEVIPKSGHNTISNSIHYEKVLTEFMVHPRD
jgi:pimeloyl-ACP methyl ester carboxylesterase